MYCRIQITNYETTTYQKLSFEMQQTTQNKTYRQNLVSLTCNLFYLTSIQFQTKEWLPLSAPLLGCSLPASDPNPNSGSSPILGGSSQLVSG